MKLRMGERVLIFFAALVGLGYVALAVLQLYFPDVIAMPAVATELMPTELGVKVGILAAIILSAILFVLVMVIIVRNREKREQRKLINVDSSENGSVMITVSAMDEMVRRAIGTHNGISNVNIRTVSDGEMVSIRLNVDVAANVNIPLVTKQLQQSVRRKVGETGGIAVRNITVVVHAIDHTDPTVNMSESAPVETATAPAEPFNFDVHAENADESSAAPEMTEAEDAAPADPMQEDTADSDAGKPADADAVKPADGE